METRHTVATASVLSFVAVLVVVAVGVTVSPAVLAQADDETSDEVSFGAQLSAFAQTTAADANASIDSGMWSARVADSANPGQAVRTRATDLEQRLAVLENRSEALEAARANLSGVAYTAKASAVRAELANLRTQVNETSRVADSAGVNGTKLADLRTAAGNATGPEVAAIARNITDAGNAKPPWAGNGDGTPSGRSGNHTGTGATGPPDDEGRNSTDGAEPPDDGTGPPNDGTGPSGSSGGQSGNEAGGGSNAGGTNESTGHENGPGNGR